MIARSVYHVVIALCALWSCVAQGGEALALDSNHLIEEKMAEWLAHPSEFGVRPKNMRIKHTYKADLITYGKVEIHLVEYTMPDGTVGRGFDNGGLTWSFLGGGVNAIKDDELFVAYCGWA
jgi:hypothetical protein